MSFFKEWSKRFEQNFRDRYYAARRHAPVKNAYYEDWFADTGTAFHMTDSLSCLRNFKPCHKNVNGIGGVSCEVSFAGTLDLVFVTDDSEFCVELQNVLYSPNLGYNLFSPSAEFDGESWNGLGGPDGVMTACC